MGLAIPLRIRWLSLSRTRLGKAEEEFLLIVRLIETLYRTL